MDFLIWQLLHTVSRYYLNKQLAKTNGFITNGQLEKQIRAVVRQANSIPGENVILPASADSAATITGGNEDVYTVDRPGTAEATCNCVHFTRYRHCKHSIKVIYNSRPCYSDCTRKCGGYDFLSTRLYNLNHLLKLELIT